MSIEFFFACAGDESTAYQLDKPVVTSVMYTQSE